MTAAAWAALALAIAVCAVWLLRDTIEARRQRRFDEHTEQALSQANHPSTNPPPATSASTTVKEVPDDRRR